jgi:phosphatidylinositol alpha-1,6-mannosyltransferase
VSESAGHILLLATEIWKSHGGIQRYMRILTRIFAGGEGDSMVLSLLDDDEDRPTEVAQRYSTCCRGNKQRFCFEAFRICQSGAVQNLVVGHVALLPLAWMLLRLGWIERYAVVLHGVESWRRLPWIYRRSARAAAVIVSTTHYTLREFRFHNDLQDIPGEVIPLASTLDDPPASTLLSMSQPSKSPRKGGLRLLTVSRLSPADGQKGVDTILHAVSRGRKDGLNLGLTIVGDGGDRRRLEDIAATLRLGDAVNFLGSVGDPELKAIFADADVFVMPSKKEGFGIVFLEAMAAGLPCIGANHGGIPEVITHAEDGFVIEYGDIDQLVFYLRVLIEAPGLYVTMSNAARKRASATSYEAMARAWHSVFRKQDPVSLNRNRERPIEVSS